MADFSKLLEDNPDRVIVPERQNFDVVMDVFRFLATLQLPDHPIAVQRELRDRCSELGRALRVWEHKRKSEAPKVPAVPAGQPCAATCQPAFGSFDGNGGSLMQRCNKPYGHGGQHTAYGGDGKLVVAWQR